MTRELDLTGRVVRLRELWNTPADSHRSAPTCERCGWIGVRAIRVVDNPLASHVGCVRTRRTALWLLRRQDGKDPTSLRPPLRQRGPYTRHRRWRWRARSHRTHRHEQASKTSGIQRTLAGHRGGRAAWGGGPQPENEAASRASEEGTRRCSSRSWFQSPHGPSGGTEGCVHAEGKHDAEQGE